MSASRKTAEAKQAPDEILIEVYHFEDDPETQGHRIGLERFFAIKLAISGRDISSNEDDDEIDELRFTFCNKKYLFRYVLYSNFTKVADSSLMASKLHIIDLLVNGDMHKGLELFSKLQELGYPPEKIVFVTAFREEVAAQLPPEQIYKLLEKPVQVAQMLDLLWDAIKSEFEGS